MTEKDIQKNLILSLTSYGWKYLGNNVSSKWVIDNLKINIEVMNKDNILKLNNQERSTFSEKEFERLISVLNKGVYFSEYRDVFMDDKILIKLDNGKDIYLNIFDKVDFAKNNFEVVEEVVFDELRNKRMDVLLLVNGIPVSNIELKRESAEISTAVNQLKDYSTRYSSIFKFIQILIASNNRDTVYFANNEIINEKFIFNYSDSNNKKIKELNEFTRSFLKPNVLHRFLTNFIVNIRDKNSLILLRGYQVHAVNAIVQKLDEQEGNGFIWHATGSGKTITSFKAAEVIKRKLNYDKVIFLVDRTELDTQTFNEYNSFLPSYNKLPDTTTTKKLVKALENESRDIIVSTIHKMSDIASNQNDKYKKLMNKIRGKKIVFIFDEGHRSQAGEMNKTIRSEFFNSRFIGFTGTPIFDEEVKEKINLKLTTTDIFDQKLHSYLIQNAIEDKNVLPFNAIYHEPNKNVDIKKYLRSAGFVKKISEHIVDTIDKKTLNRKYVAMLVAADVNTAINFYNTINNISKTKESENSSFKKLNVAITFSMGQGYEDNEIYRREAMRKVINDFNQYSDSNESAEDIKKYGNRMQSILRDDSVIPVINLVIVVDKLLTGFDAKRINTMFIAKDMKMHSLIQAISRTNRVFDFEKTQGEIVSFVPNFKSRVDKALEIYADESNSGIIFRKNINVYIANAKRLLDFIESLDYEEIVSNPIENFKSGKKYINNVEELNDTVRILNTMDEFEIEKISENFTFEKMEQLINKTQKLKNVANEYIKSSEREIKINPYDDITLPITIIAMDKITARYIWEKLSYVLLHSSKGDEYESKRQVEELLLQLEAREHKLFDSINKFKNLLDKGEEIDLMSFFKKEIDEVQEILDRNYNIFSEKIDEQLKNYEFYGEFRHLKENLIEIVKRLPRLKNLEGSFKVKNQEKNKIMKEIEEFIDSIRISKDILNINNN